ncbi:DotU family type IV/VI secretion system protein [Xenorhabdus sp. 42]|uniref:DotU family type IV/VI secretion system protein n=1 Tax=Xenorhabdus szentirmaii TaxID=290112 RepID=A0AAW3YY62_9GAMM|nr:MULTISPECIES: type VI secretion system protein TssL, short form [Xenorhabdus]MBD2782724.1 DotU family type IV/VI secretion system protein [Xenorhabdus sp. 38]MBD2794027.1 DotU family type IV/VI secretion system protein [Xenorhabdus sp. CUL]MBD2802321.1 DotU family type IV/VI secretion system protein [Xenorhabdus sp. M]MBD2803816.1 DotU family type IV/VI secretion system protein [Xenorhabdus sp. ZM]MBD2822720.1 DotU family type IV/VI secretion system protein [Xenorhabdus sp. 42]
MNNQNKNIAVTIDTLFADTWLMVCQLRNGVSIENGKALYRRACEQIDKTRQSLIDAGFSNAAIDHMSYAQCALLDESVMNRGVKDAGYEQWLQSPLQTKYFNTLEAGDKLWDRIRTVLHEPAPDPAVLICFHRVLTLGFSGKYQESENNHREDVLTALTNQVPPYALVASQPLVSQPARYFSRRRIYWLGWIGGLVALGALWWGLSSSLQQLVHQWLNQG